MDVKYRTEQEEFWAGEFGADYIQRNQGAQLLASNLAFFSKALRHAGKVSSCIEFGANIGMNLAAINLLYPGIDINAIEINSVAAKELEKVVSPDQIINKSILDAELDRQRDLVLIKGVLIHINPEALQDVYEKLYEASGRYILISEYYNPNPVSIPYRGHNERLFKRDFAGEILERFPKLNLLDYGFVYRRDPAFPQDDTTWFLLEKR